jgi:alanyl-tRNA synthetase
MSRPSQHRCPRCHRAQPLGHPPDAQSLREVLGEHVQQKGSWSMPRKPVSTLCTTRPITDAQIREIERRVNAEILANAAAQARVMDIESPRRPAP